MTERTDKYTIDKLIFIANELQKIDIGEKNSITTYLIARNVRKLQKFVSDFEEERKKIMSDGWFVDFQAIEDRKEAEEKYKEELKGAEEEIQSYLKREVEFCFYTRKIEELNFSNDEIIKFMDLIGE